MHLLHAVVGTLTVVGTLIVDLFSDFDRAEMVSDTVRRFGHAALTGAAILPLRHAMGGNTGDCLDVVHAESHSPETRKLVQVDTFATIRFRSFQKGANPVQQTSAPVVQGSRGQAPGLPRCDVSSAKSRPGKSQGVPSKADQGTPASMHPTTSAKPSLAGAPGKEEPNATFGEGENICCIPGDQSAHSEVANQAAVEASGSGKPASGEVKHASGAAADEDVPAGAGRRDCVAAAGSSTGSSKPQDSVLQSQLPPMTNMEGETLEGHFEGRPMSSEGISVTLDLATCHSESAKGVPAQSVSAGVPVTASTGGSTDIAPRRSSPLAMTAAPPVVPESPPPGLAPESVAASCHAAHGSSLKSADANPSPTKVVTPVVSVTQDVKVSNGSSPSAGDTQTTVGCRVYLETTNGTARVGGLRIRPGKGKRPIRTSVLVTLRDGRTSRLHINHLCYAGKQWVPTAEVKAPKASGDSAKL